MSPFKRINVAISAPFLKTKGGIQYTLGEDDSLTKGIKTSDLLIPNQEIRTYTKNTSKNLSLIHI